MELSDRATTLAAILVFSLVTVETGGLYLLRIVGGRTPTTAFQRSFSRAGHAHAGVLLTLSLVAVLYAEAADVGAGAWGWLARTGVPIAAVLMPAGFFFASAGQGRTRPNRWIVLVHLGAVSLAAGLLALGFALLAAA